MDSLQNDPNVWTLEITLAHDDWSSDWGAPNAPQNVASVFPQGVAAFKGLNIPVEAGQYRVTFNSQTFAYSFERLPDP